MTARLYSNENFPLPVVEALRRLGHDVLTTHDTGKSNAGVPDEEVLRYAAENGRAVLTHNRQDFIRLHRQNPGHAGIIVCTDNPDFPALAARVHAELQKLDSLAGQLVRVNRGA
jgi:predicted nuclease of predicted toxin-antitoxin system